MRKCMFLPAHPPRDLATPRVSSSVPDIRPTPIAPTAREEPIVPRKRDPKKDVQMFAAFDQEKWNARVAKAQARRDARAWWEDPIALGSLLIVCPPIGVAAVWSSKHYSTDARWAITVMTALMMCLVTSMVFAALVLR